MQEAALNQMLKGTKTTSAPVAEAVATLPPAATTPAAASYAVSEVYRRIQAIGRNPCFLQYAFEDKLPSQTHHACVLTTSDGNKLGEGSGLTKQRAKEAAAQQALEQLEKGAPSLQAPRASLSPAGTTAETQIWSDDRQLLFDILCERNEHFCAKLDRVLSAIGEQLSAEEVVEFARSVRVLHEQQGGASAGRRFYDGLCGQVAAAERARAVAAEAEGDVILDDLEEGCTSG